MGHMSHFKYKHNFIQDQDTLVEQLIEQSPQHYKNPTKFLLCTKTCNCSPMGMHTEPSLSMFAIDFLFNFCVI